MAHPSSPQLVAATPVTCVATPSSRETSVETHGHALCSRRIGRYHLLHRIGAGGMGSVHLGLATGAAGFQKWIAIKQLNTRFAEDSSFVRRFRIEARISAAVIHPNVVQVLDVAEEGGELLLIMEYVHGVTLAQLQRDLLKHGKRLPVIAAVSLILPVLHGLQAVHTASGPNGEPLRIVHRDVSPQNIMVDASGHVRLLDFGVARATAQTQATGLGVVAGKLAYLAPEQAEGRFDARSDLFAAGVVLWEALTGRRLFGSSESGAATLQRTLWRSIPPPSQIHSDIPPALDRVVLRALCRNAEQRYQTAHEFAAALSAAYQPAAPGQLGGLVRFACDKRLKKKQALLAEARSLTRPLTESGVDAPRPTAEEDPPGATQVSSASNKEGTHFPRPLVGAAALVAGLLCGLAWWGASQRQVTSHSATREAAAPVVPFSPGGGNPAPTSVARLAVSPHGSLDGSSLDEGTQSVAVGASGTSKPSRVQAPASAHVPSPPQALPKAQRSLLSRSKSNTRRKPRVERKSKAQRNAKAVPKPRLEHSRNAPRSLEAAPPGPARPRPSNTRAAPTQPSTPSTTPDCNPPTYLALDGIRHFKKGCL